MHRSMVILETGAGRQLRLRERVITIGRHGDNHVVLNDPRVSRFHAKITMVGDDALVFDLKSRNGVKVNGRYARSSLLVDRDTISIGPVLVRFSRLLLDAGGAA